MTPPPSEGPSRASRRKTSGRRARAHVLALALAYAALAAAGGVRAARGERMGPADVALTPSGAGSSTLSAHIPAWVLDDTWTEVRAQHVTVITNAGARVGVGLAKRLELFGAALGTTFPTLRPFPALPTDVYALRTPAMVDAFRPRDLENVAGSSAAAPLRNVILLSAGQEELDRNRVLCEQYVRLFVAANFADLPLWLDVGLAQYFGTFRPMGPAFEVGHRRAAAMEWLKQNEWADLDLLFAATTDARAYQKDNPLRRTLFAQGWVLTRWLLTHRAADFDRIIASMRRGVRARPAFEASIPRDEWPALVDRARRYVRDDFLDVRTVRYAAPAAREPVARVLGSAEALLRVGELAQDLDPMREGRARGYFEASLARDSSRARAWARLGLANDAAGDTAGAERAFRRALARAADEPSPYLLAGMGAVTRARRIAARGDGDAPTVDAWLATGRERLSRCLQLAPDHPQALAVFGESFVDDAAVPPVARRALERAAAELPSRRDVAGNLARVRARERVVASATPAGPPERPSAPTSGVPTAVSPAASLREQALRSRFREAWRAEARGDFERAVASLLRARTIATHTADIDSMIAVDRTTLKLARARRLATAGTLRAARDTLAGARGLPADHDVMMEVASLRAELTARLEIERGLALARAGDRAAARAAFESVARMPVDETIRRYARERVQDLDRNAATR